MFPYKRGGDKKYLIKVGRNPIETRFFSSLIHVISFHTFIRTYRRRES